MSDAGLKYLACGIVAVSLSGCGWFRTDLPVRAGPQSEPHVTYANSGAVAQRMVSNGGQSQDSLARFRSICGAGSYEAAVNAATAMGVFNPPSMSPLGVGGRTALFEDGRRDAALITSAPAGFQCFYTDGAQTWTWNPDGRVTVEAARS